MLLKTILLSSVAFLLYIGIRRKRSLILNPPNIVKWNGEKQNKFVSIIFKYIQKLKEWKMIYFTISLGLRNPKFERFMGKIN